MSDDFAIHIDDALNFEPTPDIIAPEINELRRDLNPRGSNGTV